LAGECVLTPILIRHDVLDEVVNLLARDVEVEAERGDEYVLIYGTEEEFDFVMRYFQEQEDDSVVRSQ
jgi:hypothetical protein